MGYSCCDSMLSLIFCISNFPIIALMIKRYQKLLSLIFLNITILTASSSLPYLFLNNIILENK